MGNRLGVYGQAENGDGNQGDNSVDVDSVGEEVPLIEDIPDVNENTPSQELDNIISMIISKYEAVISSGQLVNGNLATIPELKRRNQQLQGTLAKIIQIMKEKQNVTAQLNKHNEALQHQVDSLKDVIAITRDLLNIRNMEVDHLHEDMQALQDKITLERKRQAEITEKMENASKLNDSLKAEYQKQMDLFSKLRTKYDERQDALTRENALLEKQLEIARNIVNSAQNDSPVSPQAVDVVTPSAHIISPSLSTSTLISNTTTTSVTPQNTTTDSITNVSLNIKPSTQDKEPKTSSDPIKSTVDKESAASNDKVISPKETNTSKVEEKSNKSSFNSTPKEKESAGGANGKSVAKEIVVSSQKSAPKDNGKDASQSSPKEEFGVSVTDKGVSKDVSKSLPKENVSKDVSKSFPKENSTVKVVSLNDEEDEDDESAVSVVLKSVDNVLRLETSVEREAESEVNIVDSD
uniref:Uncharacterized protein n=1 Tax=Cacopsylla melanoneura TaxID=428564 RepID=A0A8D9FKG0_9HEMI